MRHRFVRRSTDGPSVKRGRVDRVVCVGVFGMHVVDVRVRAEQHTRFNPVVSGLTASTVGTMVLKGTGATGFFIDSSPAVATTLRIPRMASCMSVRSRSGQVVPVV